MDIDDKDLNQDLGPEVGGDEPKGQTVRETIEAAWKEHGGELPEKPEKPKRGDRNERGQFTKRADTATPGAKPADGATGGKPAVKPGDAGMADRPAAGSKVSTTARDQGAAETQTPAGAKPGADASAGGPPQGWTNEAKAQWDKLPAEIKAAVTKREADIAKGVQQLQQRYGGIHQLGQRAAPLFSKYGRTIDQGFEQIVAWFEAIERNPQVAIAELAKSYRLDLAKLGTPTQTSPNASPNGNASSATPAATGNGAVDPRIDQLFGMINEMRSAETVRTQSATQEALKGWAANKPHFDKVRTMMAQVIAGAAQMQDNSILDATGVRIDLDKVYERAIYLVPEVRAEIEKAQRQVQREARQAEADRARRAGVGLRPGAPGDGSKPVGDKPRKKAAGLSHRDSVRADIKAAIEELRS